jgi:mono/diheme cytochrome c family protein
MRRLTKPEAIMFLIVSLFIYSGLESCKHEPNTINGENPVKNIPGTDTSSLLNGTLLYANNCASCHGPLATSTKLGRTASQIQSGISTIGDMRFLSTLTLLQIQAIANVLKASNPIPDTSQILDGTILYTNKCASCHGPLASSTKLGSSVTQIQNGIHNVSGMNFLSALTLQQIQAIANVLKTTNPLPDTTQNHDGTILYTNNCESCHGPLSSSTKLGSTVSQIQNGIQNVGSMNFLSTLTANQLQAISDVLKTTDPIPTPTDGATLYSLNCASCHGPLATSSKLGSTATQIQNGISNISNMNFLTSLTTSQIQAIADVLKTTDPIPTPTDGASLYAAKCASCHGPLATSSKLGASVTRIQNGINNVSNMNSLSSLTADQIKQISDVLISTPMPKDGASLYAINCASCHRSLASSEVGSSSVSKIQEAIREKRQMNYLSVLTLEQLQAISGALAGIAGGDD